MLAVLRFNVPPAQVEGFVDQLRAAVAILGERDGFVNAQIGTALDDPGLVILTLRWASVGSYRRALGHYDVKLHVIPLLAATINEPTAFEVRHTRSSDGVVEDAAPDLSPDAGLVGPS